MLDGFDRLRHHAIVRRDHEHDDIRDLGTSRPHRREGRVARRVDERDDAARRLYVVSADVLRDSAGLARRNLGGADVVEERGLAVIDMAHDRDHWGPRDRIDLIAVLGLQGIFQRVLVERLGRVAHLLDHQHCRVLIERLVDGRHDAHVHQRLDHLAAFHRHLLREFGNGDRLGDRHFALNRLRRHLEAVAAIGRRRHAATGAHRLLLLVPRADVGRDVQLLAAIARCLVVRLRRSSRRPLDRLAVAIGLFLCAMLRLAAGFVLNRPARRFLGTATIFLFAALAGLFVGFALLGFLDRTSCRLLGLAYLVDLFLRHACLLLEHAAIDIRALGAHLDAYRPRATLGGTHFELALRLALQRDLARPCGGRLRRMTVRTPQVRQQLALRFIADPRVCAGNTDTRFVKLLQQLVDRNLQNLGELGNRHVRH